MSTELGEERSLEERLEDAQTKWKEALRTLEELGTAGSTGARDKFGYIIVNGREIEVDVVSVSDRAMPLKLASGQIDPSLYVSSSVAGVVEVGQIKHSFEEELSIIDSLLEKAIASVSEARTDIEHALHSLKAKA